jgi:hypothetical protein
MASLTRFRRHSKSTGVSFRTAISTLRASAFLFYSRQKRGLAPIPLLPLLVNRRGTES